MVYNSTDFTTAPKKSKNENFYVVDLWKHRQIKISSQSNFGLISSSLPRHLL